MSTPLKLAVLVSGRGSNLAALLRTIQQGSCRAQIACVLSDRADTPALELARTYNIETHVVAARDYRDRAEWDRALSAQLATAAPELVVLAGFMRLLGPAFLERFEGRIINVHPSLLPAFPGVDGPAQAVRARVRISGCTVHLVDAGIDTGTILAQAAVPVRDGDDAASLHARIQQSEHALLPAVIDAIARGALQLSSPPVYHGVESRDTNCLVWPPLI